MSKSLTLEQVEVLRKAIHDYLSSRGIKIQDLKKALEEEALEN